MYKIKDIPSLFFGTSSPKMILRKKNPLHFIMLTEESTYEIRILQATTKFLLLLHTVVMEAPQYKQKKMYVLNT